MTSVRLVLICGFVLPACIVVYGQEPRTTPKADSPTVTPKQETVEKLPAGYKSQRKPAFPLVVRIDDKALDTLRAKDIRNQGAVDRIILGTHAVGTSWTTGGIDVQIVPKPDDASIIIRFHGNTRTKTTGYNGPAIIHSHTDTEFDCARQIVFEPRVGLVAGKPTVAARTSLAYDGFDANRRLGRKVISRVAQQRAHEQLGEAEAIAHRDNQAEVCRAFEKRLDTQLASMNRQLDIARYVNAVFGPASKPHLAVSSCQNCILVGFGNEKGSEPLAKSFPERKHAAPIEIWVHSSMLGERVTRIATVAEIIENKILPVASQLQVMQVIFGLTQPEEKSFEVSFHEGWIVIGLKNEQPKSALAILGF